MKKFLVTILAILYLGTSSGVVVQLHYCMDKFVGYDFHADSHDACTKCGMKKAKKGHCCKDVSKVIKIQDANQLVKSNIKFLQSPIATTNYVAYSYYQTVIPSNTTKYLVISQPYYRGSVPIYLRNRVFRI